MADEDVKSKKKVVKEPKAEKVVKPSIPTIASLFKNKFGIEGAKDRKEMAGNIFTHLQNENITTNAKGKEITLTSVFNQVNAITRDIKLEKGKEKDGWHSTFVVEENKEEGSQSFKIVPK